MIYTVNTALRTDIISDSNAREMLLNIFKVMDEQNFGYRKAAQIVGGIPRLNRLMDEGKIRYYKNANVQNGKYFLNASDVLRYTRPGYKTRKRTTS